MKKLFPLLVVLALSFALAQIVLAQTSQTGPESKRQVIVRVAPLYPQAARRIRLGGTVKAVALVGSDGKVKKVDAVGGSPLLVDSAEKAISQWKYAPGIETQESVELHFTP
jgi:outer membrane biosynthesis protein TonB